LDLINKKKPGRITKSEYSSLRIEYIRELFRKYPRLSKLKYEPIKIGKTSLNKYLGNFFFIPAVQDIEEETRYTARGKKNLNSLMNYVLDQMQNPKRKKEKEEEIQKVIKEIYHIGEKSSEIYELENVLNEELKTFDNSKLSFDAELPDLSKLIRDSLKIYIDDGISTEVYDKGHGLQRYFMVILFKVWSEKLPEMRLKQEKEKEKEGIPEEEMEEAVEEREEPEEEQKKEEELPEEKKEKQAETPEEQLKEDETESRESEGVKEEMEEEEEIPEEKQEEMEEESVKPEIEVQEKEKKEVQEEKKEEEVPSDEEEKAGSEEEKTKKKGKKDKKEQKGEEKKSKK